MEREDEEGCKGVTSIGDGFLEGTGCDEVDMSWFHGERTGRRV